MPEFKIQKTEVRAIKAGRDRRQALTLGSFYLNTHSAEPNHQTLAGKTAMVTGASRGIGREIALRFAAAGANVIVHAGSNRTAADEVAASVADAGCEATVVVANISDRDERKRMLTHAFGWRGSVDIWVNNAGADVLTGAAANWTFDEKLARLWAVDVLGTIGLSRSAGARMRANGGGTILNIGWDQAEVGQGGDSGEIFSTTKGAIMAFSRSLAKSLAPTVRVNCLAPGWIRTSWGESTSTYWDERARGESLVGRWGTVEDVAQAALFLASPAGAFINGQVLPVNGGLQPWPTRLTQRGNATQTPDDADRSVRSESNSDG